MARHGSKIFFVVCALIALALTLFVSKGASQIVKTVERGIASKEQPVDPAIRAGMLPHKALYEIRLSGKKSGTQIVNIAGQMMYEWETGCEGWTTNHKFNLLYEYADAAPMRVTSDFSTYEPFDGQTLNFNAQRRRGGEIFEEIRGYAALNDDGAGHVDFRIPDDLTYDLPVGTLFPMQHTLAVLKNIRDGKRFFNAVIFDGSDQDGPVEINAFIGEAVNAAEIVKQDDKIDSELLGAQAYNVQLAFFPLAKKEAYAEYEMELVFHENGIISDMSVDYQDFAVTQKLVALEAMPAKNTCPNDQRAQQD
ncbi:MAG: hypothetical protein CMH27_11395 [Micavibrio sp.]|nr:hypothetical protein [Micavibrio sp.]